MTTEAFPSKITVTRCYSEMPASIQRKARDVLRAEVAANPDFATNGLSADCIIEQVWNALVDNDQIEPMR